MTLKTDEIADDRRRELRTAPELETLLPPLTASERDGLEKDILARGVLSPLIAWNDLLVDGHHRYAVCQKHGLPFSVREITFDDLDAARFWAWQHQESRRNLTAYQRAEIALQFKPRIAAQAKERQRASGGDRKSGPAKSVVATRPQPTESAKTRDELAGIAKIGGRTIDKVEFIAEHADEKTKEKLRSGTATINAEFKRLKKAASQREREAKKQADILIPPDERLRLFTSSVAVARIEAESVDVIVTDPPYPKEFLPVYGDLAKFAQHVLKPGGSLLCMIGQSYLPEIVRQLAATLRYRWTLAYLTPGGQATQLWERKVNTFWKPVLWFTKGDYGGDWIGDVTGSKTNDNDKRHHRWGQSESGMFDLMERFSYPNMTVCDPFLGGGTTGLVALSLGCRFIGCDVDPECVERSRDRLARSMTEEVVHEDAP